MLPTPHIEATIAGDVSGQVAVGSYIVQNNVDHGGVLFVAAPGEIPVPRPRPLPVRLPGRSASLIGRASEVAAMEEHLAPACPLLLQGPPGIGKTALLKRAAHDYAQRTPDGSVIYHSAISEPLPDTFQFLFEAFYECDVPFKPADAQLRHALADASGLVALDDMVLDRDQFTALVDILPRATLLLASERRWVLSVGRTVAVGPLLPDDALALLGRALGRPLEGQEAEAGGRVTAMLGNEPLRILQVAALVGTLGHVLSTLAPEMEEAAAPNEEVVRRLVASLDDEERSVLEVLCAVVGAALTAEHLALLTGLPEVTPEVDSLIRLHLAQAHSPRYSATVGALPAAAPDDLPARLAAAAQATASHHETAAELAGATLRTMEAAEARSDWGAVLALGRAAESALIVGRRWGAWGVVLEAQLRAATAVGDRPAEAWARHQLGTRALCMGDAGGAEEELSRALDLRRDLRDNDGANATQHNLDLLLSPAAVAASGRSKPRRRRLLALVLAALALAVAVAVALTMNRSSERSAPAVLVAARDVVEFGTLESSGRAAQVLELVNRGSRPSQPVRLVVDGPERTDFAVDPSDCRTVGPGESCRVTVTFSPSGAGPRRATLRLTADPRPLAQLRGQGRARPVPVPVPPPQPRVEPSALDFGEVPFPGPARAASATVVNGGTGELSLLGLTVVGEAASDFTVTLDCPTMRIAPGGVCAIGVVFVPGRLGPRTARLDVLVGGTDAVPVGLVGFGIEAVVLPEPVVEVTELAVPTVEPEAPIFAFDGPDVPVEAPAFEPVPVVAAVVDPTTVDFGNQPVGEISQARRVTVTNTGTTDLVIAEAFLSGGSAGDFVLVGDGCTQTGLAPGESCDVDVAFAPTSGGRASALLELRAAEIDTLAVELAGRGTRDVGPSLVPLPPTLIFPPTGVGDVSSSTVLVLNTGRSPVTIEGVVAGGDEDFSVEGGTCLPDQPVELPPGGTCEILVVFAPSEPGLRAGSVVVAVSGAEPVVVALEGRALAET